jgi:hypothetical protein
MKCSSHIGFSQNILPQNNNNNASITKEGAAYVLPLIFDTRPELPLKSFDEIPASSVVMLGHTSTIIKNRAALYCAIPCYVKDRYNDGDVVSLRLDGFYKGKVGGYFPNALIFDIWYNGDTHHTKLFSTRNIQQCGMPSEEAGILIVKSIINIVNKANEYIVRLNQDKNYRHLFRQATRWLINNSLGPEISVIETFKLSKNNELGKMEFASYAQKATITWPRCPTHPLIKSTSLAEIPLEYQDILYELIERCDDLVNNKEATHTALVDRISNLMSYQPFAEDYRFVKSTRSAIINRYDLGIHIDRYRLTELLIEMGYDAYFANGSSAHVSVDITSDLKFDENELSRDDKSGAERYAFYPKGSVKHNGCTIDLMRDTYTRLMTDVYSIRGKIAISAPSTRKNRPPRKKKI